MAVFRIEKTKDYTVMSNHHLKNKILSLKAKGLLSQMLSLPDNWDYTLKGLSMINRESVDAIREAVKELEQAGYITRSRERNDRGHLMGTDYVIYERPYHGRDSPEVQNPILENPTLDIPALENQTQLNTYSTNPNGSSTKSINYPYPSHPSSETPEVRIDGNEMEDPASIRQTLKKNIHYDSLAKQFTRDRLDEVVDLMVETLCSKRDVISVAGDDYPASLVKDRLLRLNSHHIAYVFECLNRNTTYVRNIKKYLLTTLFNAPTTIDSYYTALVNHDLYGDGKRSRQQTR